ncbi:MAG: NADH-quinone oxidoreductase subunit J [Gammaproteobacteria bacterium]|nr:NADH-quinone oxidoreductase subunit J [Gammaproteobacteria bacterium]MCF6229617.1 NADH-quinone oxidoreductase subunit J [Gammaproteobacteria bacterium]
MAFELIIFYIFSTILVGSALAVITVRNPIYAALFLVLAFFTCAGVWLLLEAEFLAITLVLVYVGAVMVLFLFVVMMLDINLAPLKEGFIRFLPVGIAVGVIILIQMAMILGPENFGLEKFATPMGQGEDYSNTKALGRILYTTYVYPFEIAAVILLVAIIAAITLTLRKRPDSKSQNVADQVKVRREDRVRLVKMSATKKDEVQS